MLTGNDIRISNMPRVPTNNEPVCNDMYAHTARMDAPAHDKSYWITEEESLLRRYPAYQRIWTSASVGMPMYGELRNAAFMPNRRISRASTSSSHPRPISSSCASSSSSAAAYPGRGAPIGYFIRVMRFTSVVASKSPSRKYPYARRSSANRRTTASTSETSSPPPSGTETTVPLARVDVVGKK